MWNGNSYGNDTGYTSWSQSVVWSRQWPPTYERHLSRAERRMREALLRESRSKLERRLAREAAEHKAKSDTASRQRVAPTTGAAPAHRHLQTYDDAMAARKAARRVA